VPAKGYTDPHALPVRLVSWLRENPGEHRARDVAEGLGVPPGMTKADWTHKVGNALGRLARDGSVRREFRDLGYKKPMGVYLIPETADAP
jgi:hypothetical protein